MHWLFELRCDEPQSPSPRIPDTSGAANAVTPAAVGVADGKLVVGIGVDADIGVHPYAHATAQLHALGLLQQRHQIDAGKRRRRLRPPIAPQVGAQNKAATPARCR